MSLAYQVRIAGIGLLALAIYADDAPPGSADALRRHVEYLASDQLQGRGNGSPGIAAAAHYIAAQFKEAGPQPAGTDRYLHPAHTPLPPPHPAPSPLRSPHHNHA